MPRRRNVAPALAGVWLAACGTPPIVGEGRIGSPIALMTGDESSLLRLAFLHEPCPGTPGGCPDGECGPMLIDSLAPLSAVREADIADGAQFLDTTCLEVRSAQGLAADPPASEDLDAAVTRFRFHRVPVVYGPDQPKDWAWTAGDGDVTVEPTAILGGNLLRSFATVIRRASGEEPTVSFFGEFPGQDDDLADQGFAHVPLQFPGALLGADIEDRCQVGQDDCSTGALDIRTGGSDVALKATRMVFDACVAAPPCALVYERDASDPFRQGTCELHPGPAVEPDCHNATDSDSGGESASLVLATGVPGLVLFDDSAERMFGDLAELPACTEDPGPAPACRLPAAGVLHLPGWPPAGTDEAPLVRLRIRSLALLPGLSRTRDAGPCERVDRRRKDGLLEQCDRWVDAVQKGTGDIRDTPGPMSGYDDDDDGNNHIDDPSARAMVILGESELAAGALAPDPERWVDVAIVPSTHPAALSIRREVVPAAIEPDGLLGTVLFSDTVTVLDYTDDDPGLRMRCLESGTGECLAAPECRSDGQTACCYGLPLTLLTDYILAARDDTCCPALSAGELAEVQDVGGCVGVRPP